MCVNFYFFIPPVFINSSGPGQLRGSPPDLLLTGRGSEVECREKVRQSQ